MKRLAPVLALVALAACTKGGQSGSSSTTMQDTSHQMMMSDTSKHMMMDSSKMMKQPAPATKQPARARTTKRP